jgi:hypothetical protein
MSARAGSDLGAKSKELEFFAVSIDPDKYLFH